MLVFHLKEMAQGESALKRVGASRWTFVVRIAQSRKIEIAQPRDLVFKLASIDHHRDRSSPRAAGRFLRPTADRHNAVEPLIAGLVGGEFKSELAAHHCVPQQALAFRPQLPARTPWPFLRLAGLDSCASTRRLVRFKHRVRELTGRHRGSQQQGSAGTGGQAKRRNLKLFNM